MSERKTIREWTRLHNCTALAREMGVSGTAMHRWVTGERIPTGKHLQGLAAVLRISTDQIDLSPEKREFDAA